MEHEIKSSTKISEREKDFPAVLSRSVTLKSQWLSAHCEALAASILEVPAVTPLSKPGARQQSLREHLLQVAGLGHVTCQDIAEYMTSEGFLKNDISRP